ncbi:hypothetical protein niasHT_003358 [Heterodera trifolii]
MRVFPVMALQLAGGRHASPSAGRAKVVSAVNVKPPEWLDCRRSGDKQLFLTVQFCECQKILFFLFVYVCISWHSATYDQQR